MTSFPRLLYHYTTQTGLLGIIKTRQLWASKIQYLNDITEFRHGLTLIREALQETPPLAVDSLTNSYVEQILERLPRLADLNVFVVSFSEIGDLLSQWRAYSGAGIGYALGLETNRIANLAFDQGFALSACIYELSEQRKKAKEFIAHQLEYFASVRPKFASTPAENAGKWIENLTSEFCQHATAVAPLFKHGAFAEEKEWRLVSQPKSFRDQAYGVRAGHHFLVPYCALSLEKDGEFIVDELTVGPTREADLARGAATGLLINNGVAKWSVCNSRIPYRTP